MRKAIIYLFIFCISFSALGCAPLIIGSAVGALGGYAASKDTIQGETDKSYDSLWNAALTVSKIRGKITYEDKLIGRIELKVDGGKAWISVIRLTRLSNRLRVSCRKLHLPDFALAQEIFTKIMEEAR